MSDKLEQLHQFLDKNVASFATPSSIMLSEFKFNPDNFEGSFKLTMDQIIIEDRFHFSAEIDGKYGIYSPMYISPLGVPASYPAIKLTSEANRRIKDLINGFFPKLRPFGLNKETDAMIDGQTPKVDRLIDSKSIQNVIGQISKQDFFLISSVFELS